MSILTFLDLDETLFPTSKTVRGATAEKTFFPAGCRDYILTTFQDASCEAIHKSAKAGYVVVVSAGESRWIEMALNLLPKVKTLIVEYKIPVVSAYMTDGTPPSLWKHRAFSFIFGILLNDLAERGRPPFRTIVSIGDSHAERDAAIQLVTETPTLERCRTYTMRGASSLAEATALLRAVTLNAFGPVPFMDREERFVNVVFFGIKPRAGQP